MVNSWTLEDAKNYADIAHSTRATEKDENGVPQLTGKPQLRKYSDEPYIVHPTAVVKTLQDARIIDESVLAAAYLHDVLEDTATTPGEVAQKFDQRVVTLILENTNISDEVHTIVRTSGFTPAALGTIRDKFGNDIAAAVEGTSEENKAKGILNRKTRKEIDSLHFRDSSPEGQTIKLADMLCNLRDLETQNPSLFRTYMQESEVTVGFLTKGNDDLRREVLTFIEQRKNTPKPVKPESGFFQLEISAESRILLLKTFPPKYSSVFAEHITVGSGKSDEPPLMPQNAVVIGVADDGKGLQALVIKADGSLERPDGKMYHVTLSLDPEGMAPKEFDVTAKPGKEKERPYKPVASNGLVASVVDKEGKPIANPNNPGWNFTNVEPISITTTPIFAPQNGEKQILTTAANNSGNLSSVVAPSRQVG